MLGGIVGCWPVISEPLFYSNVRLAIDDVNTSRGFRIQFEDDIAGVTTLNAGNDTVNMMAFHRTLSIA